MQPTYLPWIGYFDMMRSADVFVLLDNVQFAKKSWQQRNRIKAPSGPQWLTVPVKTSGRFRQTLSETQIVETSGFARKHLRALETNYSRAKYRDYLLPRLAPLIGDSSLTLSLYNETLIRSLAQVLEIETKLIRASEMSSIGRGTQLTVNQLVELEASVFLAAPGSKDYVDRELGFRRNGIAVEYHSFIHPEYPQPHGTFVSSLSVVDLLLNCGPESASILWSKV